MKKSIVSLCLIVLSQGAAAFMVSVPLETPLLLFPLGFATGSTSGHEEITRQAMNRLESNLLRIGIDAAKLSPEFLGGRDVNILSTHGLNTPNMIIKGNYSTDMPSELIEIFNIPEFHDQPLAGWTNNPNIQVLHFLRNIDPKDGSLYSQFDTCVQAKEKIIKSTLEGVKRWIADDQKSALFLFGHATHTIQDSFSHAHTLRDKDSNNSDLLKVCYYGPMRNTSPDACYHQMIDTRDDIWFSNPINFINKVSILIPLEKTKEGNLKAEAKLARTATMRYLFLVATFIHDNKLNGDLNETQLIQTLNKKLFEGLTGMTAVDQGEVAPVSNLKMPMPNGIIRCERLSRKVDSGELLSTTNKSAPH